MKKVEFVRRVQLLGKSTYAVTLPKEWARLHGLTRGSKVFMEVMSDGSLRIKLAPLLHEYRASRYIKFSSNEEADQVFFEVASALISGYDFVIVSFNELTSSYIKAFCDKLSRLVPGLQVEQEGFEVKISTLGERSSRTLETRVSLVVKLLAEALKSPDKLSLAVL
ncbi:MAG: AbrB/MazE/SpoVT family DNA-binding domain-containing protein, partial [Acidilobaceae archaeon]